MVLPGPDRDREDVGGGEAHVVMPYE